MTDQQLLIASPLIVAIFSVVQSIFGVGLLLFGTPTLLLLGLPFLEAIAALLPCSLAVDLLQMRNGLPADRSYLVRLVILTLPLVCAGLVIAINSGNPEWLALLVGIMLLTLAALRITNLSRRIQASMVQFQSPYMAVMGFLHGLSNMGGGLLVMLASSLTQEKEETRRLIATGYSLFAVTQLATLCLFTPQSFYAWRLLLPLVAVGVYMASNLLYRRLEEIAFQRLLTTLILAYGVLLVFK